MQPHGYDRPLAFPPFLSVLGQKTSFFFSISALSRRIYCIVIGRPLGYPTKSYLLSSSSSPAWSALCSHSAALSTSLPRLPTFVIIKYLSSGLTACSRILKLKGALLSRLPAMLCHLKLEAGNHVHKLV